METDEKNLSHKVLLKWIRQREISPKKLLTAPLSRGYTVIDLETTGAGEDITEVGLLKVNPYGQITKAWSQLVMPEGLMNDHIIRMTGIHPDMVIDQPRIDDVLPMARRLLQDEVLVGHSISVSDLVILNDLLQERGLPLLDNPFFDTYDIARYLYPKGMTHGYSVESLCHFFSISPLQYHRALEDCKAEHLLFQALLDQSRQSESISRVSK
jgi:DNA polymerase-3 subunit alpha (Gram-positive type)